MSVDITAEVFVRRPAAEIAAYMNDPAHDPEWIGGVREARLLGEPPLGVGSRVARVARFLGRRIEYVTEVVALEPGRVLDMRTTAGPFPMRITYELAPADGGTTVRNHVRGGGPRIVAPLVRRNVQRDLERLRDLVDGASGPVRKSGVESGAAIVVPAKDAGRAQ